MYIDHAIKKATTRIAIKSYMLLEVAVLSNTEISECQTMICKDGAGFVFANELDELAGITCGVGFMHCSCSFCGVENKEGCKGA